jgi:hypothetical protein
MTFFFFGIVTSTAQVDSRNKSIKIPAVKTEEKRDST